MNCIRECSQDPQILKGNERKGGRVRQRKMSCSPASTEVSTNITGSSEVGRAFQSYTKLGEGGQAFIPHPRVQSLDGCCPRKAV